jgi:hypothetical protein
LSSVVGRIFLENGVSRNLPLLGALGVHCRI